ncbi:MAG TPA: glycosyltransferase [Blastocatellia bacterium]|nr:glycosyltransferase [Blastocatellia bacterium]
MQRLMEQVKPGLVLVLADLWVIPRYLEVLRIHRAHTKVIAYCPVDGRILDPGGLAWLPEVSKLVVYTKFAKQEIEGAMAALAAQRPGFHAPEIAVIPHGTSTDLFYPYPDRDINQSPEARREDARRKLFLDGNLKKDSFIVLNASRNQPRKRIDLTLEGFALFAQNKPDTVRLYLHMGMKEIGWNIRALAREFGIADRLLTTTDGPSHPSVSERQLNLIYNACDVGINTAGGEGWGLACFEHAATGAAQIVPRHSGCAELWTGAAIMLEPVKTQPMGRFLEASIVSAEGVAAALESLYRDPSFRHTMSRAAYANATQPRCHWENIARAWDELFNQALAGCWRNNKSWSCSSA